MNAEAHAEVLVLNFTYEVLSVSSLKRALKLIFAGKAEVVENAPGLIRTPRYVFARPSIVRMLYFVQRPWQEVPLTKKNVLTRDNHTCQYCGMRDGRTMTIDHVIPKAMGGDFTWENLVTACKECNNRKNNRPPWDARMALRAKPKKPKLLPWSVFRKEIPSSWGPYLFHV